MRTHLAWPLPRAVIGNDSSYTGLRIRGKLPLGFKVQSASESVWRRPYIACLAQSDIRVAEQRGRSSDHAGRLTLCPNVQIIGPFGCGLGAMPPKKRARAGDGDGLQPRQMVTGCATRVGPTERARLLASGLWAGRTRLCVPHVTCNHPSP